MAQGNSAVCPFITGGPGSWWHCDCLHLWSILYSIQAELQNIGWSNTVNMIPSSILDFPGLSIPSKVSTVSDTSMKQVYVSKFTSWKFYVMAQINFTSTKANILIEVHWLHWNELKLVWSVTVNRKWFFSDNSPVKQDNPPIGIEISLTLNYEYLIYYLYMFEPVPQPSYCELIVITNDPPYKDTTEQLYK